jgi:hypothetical protein
MDSAFLDFYLNEQVQIGLVPFIKSIVVATLLSFIIQLTYLKFSNSLSNKYEFSKIFIILGLATTLVITIVKSSLALSLGLVGALSIVRFRAAIKDPEELVYLFLVISTGLGCGAGQIKITTIGISLALVLIVIFNLYWRKNQKMSGELINASFIYNKRISGKETDELTKKLEVYCKKITFISMSSTETQSTINLDITPNDYGSIGKISDEIQNLDKNIKVMFAKDNLLSL